MAEVCRRPRSWPSWTGRPGFRPGPWRSVFGASPVWVGVFYLPAQRPPDARGWLSRLLLPEGGGTECLSLEAVPLLCMTFVILQCHLFRNQAVSCVAELNLAPAVTDWEVVSFYLVGLVNGVCPGPVTAVGPSQVKRTPLPKLGNHLAVQESKCGEKMDFSSLSFFLCGWRLISLCKAV